MSIANCLIFIASLLCVGSSAIAQSVTQAAWLPDAVFVQSSAGEHTRSLSGGLQWRWHRIIHVSDNAQIAGYLEATFGRWRAHTKFDSDAHQWTNQLSVVPTLRLTATPMHGWYVDAGVGPSYLSPKFLNKDKFFSTRFQFRSHVGVGYQWGTNTRQDYRHDLAVRAEHFSNAGYATPNPGVNLFAIRYTRVFH